MATTADLVALGFASSSVTAVTLNLPHPDPFGMGPFCRLRVQTSAPQEPGVYAWVADHQVCYVGKADRGLRTDPEGPWSESGTGVRRLHLLPTFQGAQEVADPRSRQWPPQCALVAGQVVEWWWLVAARPAEVEGLLIQRWDPPWNIALRLLQ